MSTLENIKQIMALIIQDTDTNKPDLYCSESVFIELSKRADCRTHPTQKNTIVMIPNVYWVKDVELTETDIVAYTNRGALIVDYLMLVSQLIFDEHGSLDDVNQLIQEFLDNKNNNL